MLKKTVKKTVVLLLCLLVLISLAPADVLHGPGPFNASDYYYHWGMIMNASPSPPAVLSYLGDPPYSYHCYATFQGAVGPPNGFNITCAAVANAYITGRQDIAGGTINGSCVAETIDSVYSDNENAYFGSIDGAVHMAVPAHAEEFDADTQCTATGGCVENNNGGNRNQDCS